MRLAVAAFLLVAIMEATNPAGAQNFNDFDKQRAARQAQAEWRRLLPAEMACIDQRLRRKGSSVESSVRRGVKPSAARFIELRSSCRDFVGRVQTDTAPALAKDGTGSATPTVTQSDPNEPKDAGVTPSAESPTDSSVMLPSSEKTVGDAEEQVEQGNVELNKGRPERGILGWPGAFLFVVTALTAFLGIVISLFIRWRNTMQRTVAVSLPEKNSEESGDTPLETTIAEAAKVVTGEGPATLMSQDSTNISDIRPTYGEVFPEIASIEGSESNSTGNTAVENVAQLAELCAKGTPSEKDFQGIKGLISESSVQERKI
jgi:hypothetical protein